MIFTAFSPQTKNFHFYLSKVFHSQLLVTISLNLDYSFIIQNENCAFEILFKLIFLCFPFLFVFIKLKLMFKKILIHFKILIITKLYLIFKEEVQNYRKKMSLVLLISIKVDKF